MNKQEITISTQGFSDVVDITAEVSERVAAAKLKEGLVTVFITGSTAGVTTLEYEPGAVQDLKDLFERLVPEGAEYAHNERWGDGNGFSHVRASLLGPSLTVPIMDGKMVLGTWQQIVVVDFDNRARERKIMVQILKSE